MRPKYIFPARYGDDCTLVEIDVSLIPLVAGALKHFEQRATWQTESDYQAGYNAFAQLRIDLMGKCIEKLQMEIRALRGVDELVDAISDPDADPFYLPLGSIEENKRALEAVHSKLEAIRLLLEAMETAEDLEEIKQSAAQIAMLLA